MIIHLLAGLILAISLYILSNKSRPSLPPRPSAQHRKFEVYDAVANLRLSHLYGPILLLSHKTILINTSSAARHVLEKLGSSYSSRSRSIAAAKYLSRGRRMVLQPYGREWRRHQKAFVSLFTKERIRNHWSKSLSYEAQVLVDGLQDQAVVEKVENYTASSVLQIAYAKRADERILKDLKIVSQNIADAFDPARYLVEKIPLLDYLPPWLARWKQKLLRDHAFEMGIYDGLISDVKQEGVIAKEDCCASLLLQNEALDRMDVAYLAATILEAGTETTAMTIHTFLLAAACFPQAVIEARKEVDSADLDVLQPGTLPSLTSLVKETLRFTPTGTTGVGHVSSLKRDDTVNFSYLGTYSIPAGATILANIYGIHHDPAEFPNPYSFDPQRWKVQGSPHLHAFGFGRRLCPGGSIATHSLHIAIAMLLRHFDITLSSEADSVLIQVEQKLESEYTQHPDLTSHEKHLRFQSPRLSALLDAYTTSRITRSQLQSCLSLSPRS